ncbi:MAG: amino acid dehydrogenase [Gammaproteobacteria bacterium]|nr:amino acid dehydrogenase [Gammaproteobacteria bacterium]
MVDLFKHADFGHESVHFFNDRPSGLKAIIAIHNTRLGPAIGGCRMRPYESTSAALNDVLRLSQSMTYKCAIGGIPFGGGKAIVVADPSRDKTTELLHAFGDAVESLNGQYITSFDMGTTMDDVRTMGEVTAHVGGIDAASGNASASTAQGLLACIKASIRYLLGAGKSLHGIRVAIQGVGNVGGRLARLLSAQGARLVLADVDQTLVSHMAEKLGADLVGTDEILSADVDVLSPCALGGILNETSITRIRAPIIAGGANNQLAYSSVGNELKDRGVLYAPDYLANAGGIIDLHYQLNREPRENLPAHLHGLGDILRRVYERSAETGLATNVVADEIAEEVVRRGRIDSAYAS